MDEGEHDEFTIDELQLLDEKAVQCAGCDWWYNPQEEGSAESGENICDQCKDERQ